MRTTARVKGLWQHAAGWCGRPAYSVYGLGNGSDGRLRFWFEQAVRRGDPYREWEHRAECQVANISGSSFMVPVAVTRKFGFMDEFSFMYAEEVDYCFRLGSAGVPCFLVPSSIVLHDATATVQLHPQLDAVIKYYRMRNWLRMI